MPEEFYIKRDGKIRGPISEQQLNKLKADGKLQPSDLISTRSNGGWSPLEAKRRPSPTRAATESTPTLPPRRQNKSKRSPKNRGKQSRPILPIVIGISTVLLACLVAWFAWPSGESGGQVSQDPVTTVSPDPEPAVPVDILAFVDPVDCMIEGTATPQNGGLLLDAPDSWAKLEFPVSLPAEYELTLHVKSLTTKYGLAVTVPHGTSEATVLIDALYGSGIAQIDGESYQENPSAVVGRKIFEEKADRQIRVTSTHNHIAVFVDGEKLTEFEGDPTRLRAHPSVTHPNAKHPFFRATEQMLLVSATVRPISGEIVRALPQRLSSDASVSGAQELYGPALSEVFQILKKTGGVASTRCDISGPQVLYLNWRRDAELTADDLMTCTKLQAPVLLMLGSGNAILADNAKSIEVWTALGQMPHLHGLGLWANDVLDDERMEALAKNTNIKQLTLDHHTLSESESESLSQMNALKQLRLHKVKGISDNTIDLLANKLTDLEVVTLTGTGIGDSAVAALPALKKLGTLSLAANRDITDTAVPHLTKLQTLAELDITGTSITQQGVEKLREANPHTNIKWAPLAEAAPAPNSRKQDAPAPPAKSAPTAQIGGQTEWLPAILTRRIPHMIYQGEISLRKVLDDLSVGFNDKYAGQTVGGKSLKLNLQIDEPAFQKLGVRSVDELKVSDVNSLPEPLVGSLCRILEKVEGHTVTFVAKDDTIWITPAEEPIWKTRAAELDLAYKPMNDWLSRVLQQRASGEFSGTTPLSKVLAAIQEHANSAYGKERKGSDWGLGYDIDASVRESVTNPRDLTVSDVSLTGKTVGEALQHVLSKVTTHKLKYEIRYGKIMITH